MKKLVIISGVSFLAILAIVYILLTRPITPTAEHWSYPKNITSPLSVKVADQAVTLGNLEKENVHIKLEGNTFDNPLDVTVSTPDSIPDIPKEKFTPLGAPIEITTAQRRFNKPMIITLRVPEASNKDLKAGDIQVIYYNGASWDIIKPLSVDATAKTVTFETYHASGWGSAKIDIEEEIKKYSHSKTIGKMAQKNVDKIVDKIVEQGLDYLMKDQMGMKEDSAKYKIISSLANDDDYAEILDSFNKGDAGEFNGKLMVFIGKKIAENVPKSALQKALKGLSSNKGVKYAGAAGEALGYLVEGDYKDAGRVIGEKIADSFLITKLFKAAGEVVQYNIDTWKDAEIEAAYQAYKNGADHWFYGYNVDKGDFDGLYNQMRGIAVRLESEYVKREIASRENLGKRPPTDDELNAIREQVRIDLEDQFKNRLAKESDMEKEAQHLQELVESMKNANLLEDGSFGFDTDHQTTEQRMDDLVKIAEKILKDTKRKDWTSGAFSDKNSISANDMVSLVQAWFSTNGEELYAQELKDKFGITLEISSGIEPQEITVTEVQLLNGAITSFDQNGNQGLYPKIGDRTDVGFRGNEYKLKFWNIGETAAKDYGKATITIIPLLTNNGYVVTNIRVVPDKEADNGTAVHITHEKEQASSPPKVKPIIYTMQFSGGPDGTFEGVSDKGLGFKGYIKDKNTVIFTWDKTKNGFPVTFKLTTKPFANWETVESKVEIGN